MHKNLTEKARANRIIALACLSTRKSMSIDPSARGARRLSYGPAANEPYMPTFRSNRNAPTTFAQAA